jgi:hypothetical protein
MPERAFISSQLIFNGLSIIKRPVEADTFLNIFLEKERQKTQVKGEGE